MKNILMAVLIIWNVILSYHLSIVTIKVQRNSETMFYAVDYIMTELRMFEKGQVKINRELKLREPYEQEEKGTK